MQQVSSSAGVTAMPTTVVYFEGKPLESVKGANMSAIQAMVEKYYSKSKSSNFEGQGNRLGDSQAKPNSSTTPAKSWLASLVGSTSLIGSSTQSNDDDLKKALLMSMDDIQTEGSKDGKPAELQIRLPDGKTLKHTFNSRDTLGYVSKWVSTQTSGSFLLALAYPRKQYVGELLNKTLEDEGLASRGQLLVIPQ
jgi:hypothetical protein